MSETYHTVSPIFKKGYFNVVLPKTDLDMNLYRFTVYVPKTELVNPNVTGKIGTYQIKREPSKSFLKNNRIIKVLSTNYTTVDLVVMKDSPVNHEVPEK